MDELELVGYQLASFGVQLEVIGESEMGTVVYYLESDHICIFHRRPL